MIAFPVERTLVQAEPVRPQQGRQVERTGQSSALASREDDNREQASLTDKEALPTFTILPDQKPVATEGKGAFVDLLL